MNPSDPNAVEVITENVRSALAEDIGQGDVTAQLINGDVSARAQIICRQQAVLCGIAWANEVFAQLDNSIDLNWRFKDGDSLSANSLICEITGPARPILSGERTALNFLQTLSGVASTARRYADAVTGTGVKVLDTRKTVPGLRYAQKYAVRCGGCDNHRMGLYDAILIKENHIDAAGSIEAAIKSGLQLGAGVPIEIEVESIDQLRQAIEAGASRILLDNMSIDELTKAVHIAKGRSSLEASGGVNLDNVLDIARTGIDYISVGGLTKNITAVDLSLIFVH